MASTRYTPSDPRRQVGSPRPKGRDNRDTVCRNVLIYGHCRYEETCAFNHDQTKNTPSEMLPKKTLNVESPSFTPASLQQGGKKTSFTPQAASAAVFTPRGAGAVSPNPPVEPEMPAFNAATAREFTPQGQTGGYEYHSNGVGQDGSSFDAFSMGNLGQNLPNQHYNPYANDQSNLGAQSSYYPNQPGFSASHGQPLNYELYFPFRPNKQLPPNQRYMQDFFMDEELRLDIQRKAEAAHQMIVPSNLHVDQYHSLMTLDTTGRKTAGLFGHVTWVYKAISAKDGTTRCLRRLEGFRLSTELAFKAIKDWKRIQNGNIVSIYDVFTTRAFGDSSLVFSQHYYPLAKTLMETYFPSTPQNRYHRGSAHLSEQQLWSYIAQISNALADIHGANLAARCLDLSKIIITDKGIIQLSGCAVLDVVHYEQHRSIPELQQEDFVLFGRLILSLGTNTHPTQLNNLSALLEQLGRQYSSEMAEMARWLITPPNPGAAKTVDNILSGISSHMRQAFNASIQQRESDKAEMFKEYCNGRAARLSIQLHMICEREDMNGDPKWSEHGERYQLKLFRDYAFHQVDEHGRPVIDMGHMLRCLYKLDAGSPEQIRLTSRDGVTDFIISYKDLKKLLLMALAEMQKCASSNTGSL